MGRYLYYLLIFVCLCSGCQQEEAEIPVVVEDRTVLVYMIGDNSLSRWATVNMEGLMASYKGEGNLVVYVDNYSDEPRLLKLEMGDNGVCQTKVVRTYDDRNSASPEVMREVLDDVCRDFPAESYGLLLWSHGTGWLPSDLRTKAFGQDNNNWLEVNDLAQALPDGRFDFILFDACYMGAVEVAYALRNKTKYLIASPTEVWEDGFPYNEIVKYFWNGEDAYRNICRSFYDFYNSKSGIQKSGTVSLIKTAGMEKLANATRNILEGKNEKIATIDRSTIQCVDRRGSLAWYDVLYDFEDYIGHLSPTQAQQNAFKQSLSEVILFEAHTESFGQQVFFRKFCGLSCYIPQSGHPGLNDFYATLEWNKAVYQSE